MLAIEYASLSVLSSRQVKPVASFLETTNRVCCADDMSFDVVVLYPVTRKGLKYLPRLRTWLWILPGLFFLAGVPWLPVDQTYLQQQAQSRAVQEGLHSWTQFIQILEQMQELESWLPSQGRADFIKAYRSPETKGTSSNRVVSPSTEIAPQLWLWLRSQASLPVTVTCKPSPCLPLVQRIFSHRSWLGHPIVVQSVVKPAGTLPQKKPKHEQHGQAKTNTSLSFRWVLSFSSGKESGVEQFSGRLLAVIPVSTSQPLVQPLVQPLASPLVLASMTGQAKRVRWYAILPPLVAIYLVLVTRRVLLGLFLSLFLGVTLLYQMNPIQGLYHTGWTYLWKKALCQEFSVSILLFVLCLVGMINVCTRNGGIAGLLQGLLQYAKTARSSRLITACLGLVIFFDDYANTITVGQTMRPLTDRFRVSREKLAYLVDATAAPIAGLAIVSTWIGYEVGLLQDLASHLSLPWGGYQLFLHSLPFRFYCWMTILFIFLGIWLNRDFGPMLTAELRASQEGKLLRDGAQPMVDLQLESLSPSSHIPHRWYNAFVPIGMVMCGIVIGLLYSGGFFHGASLQTTLTQANGPQVFLYASVLGSLVAIGLSISQRLLTWRESVQTWLMGANTLWFAVGILLFAWSMGALSQDTGTAHYLIALLHNALPVAWAPLFIFLMAASIAFATGSSWATMSILLPTAVPLAYSLGGYPLLFLSTGAVLDGAIFGDHCSPLSDTTLFSSASSSCDHVDHVKTQAPYAVTVMLVAGGCGYLAVAYGMSPYFSPVLACCCFVLIFRVFGQTLPNPIHDASHPSQGGQHV